MGVVLSLLLSACGLDKKQQEYYSDKDNYIESTGEISFINCVDEEESIYLGFTELSENFEDTCFKIVADNYFIVKENGLLEKIEEGTVVKFMTAPKYFGDGYVMPIVAISVDGEEFLTFDEGYENLLIWLEKN